MKKAADKARKAHEEKMKAIEAARKQKAELEYREKIKEEFRQ